MWEYFILQEVFMKPEHKACLDSIAVDTDDINALAGKLLVYFCAIPWAKAKAIAMEYHANLTDSITLHFTTDK